jgi:hypothetical protein
VMMIYAFLFVLTLASASLHFLGSCLVLALLPSFSVGFLVAFRRVDAGEPVTPLHLFSGFRANFPALLRLGLFYLGAVLLSLALSIIADNGLYAKEIVFHEMPPDAAVEQVALAQGLFVIVLFPGMVAIWFAPMLAAWHNLPASQSLFFGVVACLRNFRAFAVFLAMLLGISFVAMVVIALCAQFAGDAKEELAAVMLIPVLVVLFAIVTAGNYLSYRDIFREDAALPTAAP